MNIMAKQFGHETVASLASQNRQREASVEAAAPQVGQLSVSAFIVSIAARNLSG
jgi:hypothetical protein